MVPLLLLACSSTPATGDPVLILPDPLDLPESVDPPEALVRFVDGSPVEGLEDWETGRRPELETLFSHYVYGWLPPPSTAEATRETPISTELADLALIEVDLDGLRWTLAVFTPDGDGPFDVVLGLNKCGLSSLHADPALPTASAFTEASCDPEPGSRASYWDLEAALARGLAVATVHQSELAPDDPDLPRPLASIPVDATPETSWATIGMWAYGLMRTVDVLDADPRFDRIAVFGHSRRGKTALWVGAHDPRVDLVWAHQSGTAGATLSRSFAGEPVAALNVLFPHWFPTQFHTFGDRETFLPVDQHLLLAMLAPRAVLITDGDADIWADPEGATRSVELAEPVFDLYGALPPARRIRPGDHEVTSEDWQILFSTLDERW